MAHDLLEDARGREADLLDLLEALVCHESPSGDEIRLHGLATTVEGELVARGAAVERFAAPGLGEHLVARIEGRVEEAPFMILGHLDTVHPVGTLEKLPWSVGGEIVTGPGVYDMKGGVACFLMALSMLRDRGEAPRRPLRVVLSCDEEIGSETSRPLIEEEARNSGGCLVLEPCVPGGAVKLRRKGIGVYTLRIGGIPAHAGIEPEKGASAIVELAHQILGLTKLADADRGTTLNPGTVSGGTRTNVVASEASTRIDVRFWERSEADRVDAALRALDPRDARCSLDLEGGINRYPLEDTEASRELYERAAELAGEMGIELGEGGSGGASDGNIVSSVGCPTLDGLGPDGAGAHTLDEHVLRAELPRRVALYTRLLRDL